VSVKTRIGFSFHNIVSGIPVKNDFAHENFE